MTLNSLLTFMVLSQIAVSAYLLYSFNTIERASRRRHDALAAHIEGLLADMEARLSGNPRPRMRSATGESSVAGRGETELLHPGQA
jgi:hypothetical protein